MAQDLEENAVRAIARALAGRQRGPQQYANFIVAAPHAAGWRISWQGAHGVIVRDASSKGQVLRFVSEALDAPQYFTLNRRM